jgi:hypothetical protein
VKPATSAELAALVRDARARPAAQPGDMVATVRAGPEDQEATLPMIADE